MQTTQIIDQNGSTGVRTENTTEATASVSGQNVQRNLFSSLDDIATAHLRGCM